MSAVRHLRATDETRSLWSEARDQAYARGNGAEFDRLCGEIESKMREFARRSAIEQDEILRQVGELAGERSALLAGSSSTNG